MSQISDTEPTPRSVVEAYCAAWMAGDAIAVVSMYHDDLVLTWPGRHHLAGVHEGQNASIEALLALQGLTNRVPLRIVDVLEGNQSTMIIVIERWSGGAEQIETMDVRRALEFSVADGKLRTCRVYETDQAAVDDWIISASA